MEEKMQTPEISVLVPIYNVERYLEECLQSLRDQTFEDFEVICINDGSTDSSREIIQRFMDADQRFRVIDKPNSGYGASMNQGLRTARGTYVNILESDDYLEPDGLARMHKVAKDFDAQVVKAGFYFYWSTPEVRNEYCALVSKQLCDKLENPQVNQEIFYSKPSIWSALYRRDFLEENDIVFLETPGASYQDAAFNFKVWVSAERVVYLDEAYLHYRQDNEASSVNSPGKVYCVCDEYAEMQRYLDERPERRAYLQNVLTKMKYDTYMWNFERLSPELGREFLERFSQDFKEHTAQGTIDLEMFDWWKVPDLKTIMLSPDLFFAQRTCKDEYSAIQKIKHYLDIGGVSLLVLALKQKMASRG